MKKFLILYYLILVSAWSQTVTYHKEGDSPIQGYLALPKAKGSVPGIILIHEWWGLNDDIREKANHFARQGYAALAVDLYHGGSTDKASEARQLAGAVREDME